MKLCIEGVLGMAFVQERKTKRFSTAIEQLLNRVGREIDNIGCTVSSLGDILIKSVR